GGGIAPPGPRRRTRQLEQLAREPLACLQCLASPPPLSTTFCPADPCSPGNPPPSRPPPSTAARRGLGASWVPAGYSWGGKESLGSLLQRGLWGALGESKNRFLVFWPIAAVGGGSGGG
uniref:Uncharacterized protein n=1 Tax=Nannospalax galili TaxID=1026970 RepID=A0A8C6RBT3_NANGA